MSFRTDHINFSPDHGTRKAFSRAVSMFYHTGRDLPTTISKLRDDTKTATKWYDSNLLAGNLKKYQTLLIGNNHSHENNIDECAIS